MTVSIEEHNAALRAAVEHRNDAQAAGKPHEEWYGGCVTKPMLERQIAADSLHDATRLTDEDVERLSEEDLDDAIERLTWADRMRAQGGATAADIVERFGPQGSAGTTAKFGTGAVRSDTCECFRYDLVSPIGLQEVARACAEGADKYGDWNWERGMPVHDLLNHAIAHIYGFLSGDRSEPHLGHAAWNVLAAIHSHALWPQLNDGTLRGTGCRPPEIHGRA